MGDMVIAEVLRANNKYPSLSVNKTKVLVTVFSPELYDKSLEIADKLREKDINTEVYLDPSAKMEKQLKYADRKAIPYAIIIGPVEAVENTIVIKNMSTGEQKTVPESEIFSVIKT